MQFQSIHRWLGVPVLALAFAAATPSTANAQLGYLVQGSYGFDYEAIGLGGGIDIDLGSLTDHSGLKAETTFDYFFPDGFNVWEINANLILDMAAMEGLFVGGGLNYAKATSDGGDGDGDLGLNALAGIDFSPSGKVQPFVQARVAFNNGSQLIVSGGVRF